MKWRELGNAVLVTAGLFVVIGIALCVTYLFPWCSVVFLFILVVILIYRTMTKDESKDNDSDRMAWFSNDEREEDEE